MWADSRDFPFPPTDPSRADPAARQPDTARSRDPRRRKAYPDDRVVYQMLDGVWIPLAAQVAWELGLFDTLADGPLTVAAAAHDLGLTERGVDALAAAAAALQLLHRHGPQGQELELTRTARTWLLRGSLHDQRPLLRLSQEDVALDAARASLRRVVLRGEASVPAQRGSSHWTALLDDRGFAERFLQAMSAHSRVPAEACCERIDLDAHRHLLDLGGGAGDYARAALRRQPALTATVLELPTVAALGWQLCDDPALTGRLRYLSGDFWRDPWPDADLHLFSDVLHDWSPARVLDLLKRSHAMLAPGGQVVVHELVYDPTRSGPVEVVGSDLGMLLWTGGQQYSLPELKALLAQAGFVALRAQATLGNWAVVRGRKAW